MFTATRAIIISTAIATTLSFTFPAPADAAAKDVKKTAVGVVESVDETSRTIAVKTADGAVVVAEWTKDTSVTVAHATANAADATADKTVDISKAVSYTHLKRNP